MTAHLREARNLYNIELGIRHIMVVLSEYQIAVNQEVKEAVRKGCTDAVRGRPEELKNRAEALLDVVLSIKTE